MLTACSAKLTPVIAGRVHPFAENGVVEEIGEGGERPVKTGGHAVVPILLVEDQVEVLRVGGGEAGIPENDVAIEWQAVAE